MVKFRRGLETRIQDAVATMASGRPSDTSPDEWYRASRVVDQNNASNEAFLSACQDHVLGVPEHAPRSFSPLPIPSSGLQAAAEPPEAMPIKLTRPVEAVVPRPRMVKFPPTPSYNRFSVLPVEDASEFEELSGDPQALPTTEIVSAAQSTSAAPSVPVRVRKPNWEKRLPAIFVIGVLDETLESRKSLKLKVGLETVDTGEMKSVHALLDSGATGMFIDRDYVKANKLATRALSNPSAYAM